MHASSTYTITIKKSTDEQLRKIAEFIEKKFESDFGNHNTVKADYIIQSKEAVIEETYETVWLDEDIMPFIHQIIKLAPDAQLTVDGYVDCTQNSGELQNFKITYEDYTMTTDYSGWYYEVHLDGYDSYEDYVEEAEEYDEGKILSEEEFERFRDMEELFQLEDEDESIVTEVPLDNKENEKFDAEGRIIGKG